LDCQFCTEFAAIGTNSRIITDIDEWVLLPTVGCFTPGYCLLMPIRHIDAVADASSQELSKVQASAEDMREAISSLFGPVIIAEHGPRGCELGASCCSHAHLHFIPVPKPEAVVAAYRTAGGPGRAIENLAELPQTVNGPYMYLSPRPGQHLQWPSHGFARQYVRRVCASLHGVGEYFDWRDYPFTENQAYTLDAVRNLLSTAVL
jgi:diadenosine tetraphosphate (Ap4A) HIT family hydrolase